MNTAGATKIIFGSGTRLTVESSKFHLCNMIQANTGKEVHRYTVFLNLFIQYIMNLILAVISILYKCLLRKH